VGHRVINSFSTGLQQAIPAGTVILAVGVENKPPALASAKGIFGLNGKNAVVIFDLSGQKRQ